MVRAKRSCEPRFQQGGVPTVATLPESEMKGRRVLPLKISALGLGQGIGPGTSHRRHCRIANAA